jgi:2-polyprenyl-3-methyl-5-hydroxy-6-metoxy-1,4-benzoquinol methylase
MFGMRNSDTAAQLEGEAAPASTRLDLSRRFIEPEIMDSAGISRREHREALRALARLNRLSAAHSRFWRQIRRLTGSAPQAPLRVLDVACGGGDVAIGLALSARAAGAELLVDGCDVSPVALRFARATARRARCEVRFFEIDATESELPGEYDVVCCSLFLHHLRDEQAIDLLRRLAASAQRLVLVQDLVRSRTGYVLAQLATRTLTRSQVVRVDALRSVRSAFTLTEMKAIAERAGLAGARLKRCWPERFSLVWRVP